ncbi:MAG: hypothetical protein IJI35_07530 [Kiritimatiellae bacterium]|nr:hypothetical protein [Kiritimatiellia bacterium]
MALTASRRLPRRSTSPGDWNLVKADDAKVAWLPLRLDPALTAPENAA